MNNITFVNPNLLYLLLLIVPVIVWYVLNHKRTHASIQVSTIKGIGKNHITYKHILRHVVFALRVLTIALIIFAIARPQSTLSWKNEESEGIDIVLALDISSSMLARDFQPDRLEAAKDLAIQFIAGRRNDRMGLVVFSGESFTQCPLTTDHKVLINLFRDIKSGMIEDGTAIGMGLATSVSRLKDSDAKSKVIILLTDGVNNRGAIAPVTAAELAQTFGIRVYTVGVGTEGMAPYPVPTPFGIQIRNVPVEIDEETLQEIAQNTGGEYFRATDNKKLKQIYEQIDQLEKSKIEVKEFSQKDEEFLSFVLLAAFLLLSDMILRNTLLRQIP
ncbi:MAG: VWA domain-containing protein [Bacteroidales bacterium]|nr:VWA domain-containing protein [Bacteroidales bacterium]